MHLSGKVVDDQALHHILFYECWHGISHASLKHDRVKCKSSSGCAEVTATVRRTDSGIVEATTAADVSYDFTTTEIYDIFQRPRWVF